jgi:ATP synthase F1 delta subunit
MDSLQRVLAKKYARAFVNLFAKQLTPDVIENIEHFVLFMQQRKRTLFYLQLAVLANSIKKEALLKVLAQFGLHTVFEQLVTVLLEQRRLFLLVDVSDFIRQIYKEQHNIIDFNVMSSHDLSQEQKQALAQFLLENTTKKGSFSYCIDPQLIAGVRVISESYQWEHSVRKQLRALSRVG